MRSGRQRAEVTPEEIASVNELLHEAAPFFSTPRRITDSSSPHAQQLAALHASFDAYRDHIAAAVHAHECAESRRTNVRLVLSTLKPFDMASPPGKCEPVLLGTHFLLGCRPIYGLAELRA